MKKQKLLTTMLLLFALIVGSMNGWAGTATWSGTNMIKSGSPGTSYAEYTAVDNIVDDEGNKYIGRWCYQKYNNVYLQMVQLKKLESSNSPRIVLPKFGGNISSITITATNASATSSSGTGASTALNLVKGTTYTKTYATNSDNIIATDGSSSSAQKTYTFDLSEESEDGDGLYICTVDASIRIWSIVVVYEEAAVKPTAITFKTGGTTYTTGGETKNDLGSGASVDVTIEANQTADIYYTTDGTTPTTSSTKYSSAVAITGPCTLKALAKNSAGECTESAAFKFSRTNGLAFGESEYTAYLSESTFSTTLTNPNSLVVSYSSTDEDVATVASDGTVTLKAAGETTIKATFAGNDTYVAGYVQYVLTVSDKTSAGLAFASDFIHIEEPTYNSEISAPIALTNPHSVTVAYSSSDATVATVNASTGAVTPKKLGTTTITATFEGDATYEAAAVSYTLKLGLLDAGLLFEEDSKEITYVADATYTNVFTKDTDADATFASSNTSVATVNATTGEVTVKAVGTTIISATTAKTSDYKAGEAEYTLTVVENTSAPEIIVEIPVFTETFDTNDYTGGNDGSWSGSIASGDPIGMDNSGWAFTYGYGAKQCVRFGTSSAAGSATSPELGFVGDATLKFKMGSWGSDTNLGYVSVEGTGKILNSSDEEVDNLELSVNKGSWKNFTVSLKGFAATTKIKFYHTAAKRLFLDEVTITQPGTPTVSVTVPTSGWGTYCSPYKLDLSNAATEVQAYAITGFDASAGTITFAKVTGVVPAKTPLVIKGAAGSKKIAVSDETATAPASNELTGYLSPTYYNGDRTTNTAFGMSSGNFHKLTAGTIPANRAVLFMSTTEAEKVPAEARFTFIFEDETTGITQVERSRMTDDTYYDLSGRKVAQPTKGLYIVNGKKVVIK